MAFSKVVLNGTTLMDVTNDTVTADSLAYGKIATLNNGTSVTGTYKPNMYSPDLQIMDEDLFTPWTRPTGWPDLDSLNLSMSGQDSFIYMTYRTGHVDDFCSFNVRTVSGSATVSLGTISNGTFTASSTETVSSTNTKTYWFTSNDGYSDGYIVIKITGRIDRFYLMDVTRDNGDGGGTLKYYMQPMLERIWYMPELIFFTDSGDNRGNGTFTIQKDKFDNDTGAALTSLSGAWSYCRNLQSLDISGLYTPNITNASYVFQNCHRLEHLDVSQLNMSRVTTISNIFEGCFRLKELNISNWNLSTSLTGMNYVFRYCNSLQEIQGLEDIPTDNVTAMYGTFVDCYALEDLSGVTNWNVSKVTNMQGIFQRCSTIKTLDISSWDVSKVTNIANMFYACNNLEEIKFPQTQTGTLTGSMIQLFYYCLNLQNVDLSWIKPITSAVTSISYMFYNCRSLTEINFPEGWDVTGCTAAETFYRLFGCCDKLERITGIEDWDASGYNYSMNYFFDSCYSLKEVNIKNWAPNPTSMQSMFSNCWSLEEIDLTGWGWNNLTGSALSSTFNQCLSLKEIKGIEHMGDAGNINNLSNMFNGCFSLTSLPNISSWDVSKVTTCAAMFTDCRSLRSLTISNWNLAACTTIANMFRYCYNLEELELTGWTLSALTAAADYIFDNLYNLTKFSGIPIKVTFRIRQTDSLPEDQWIRIFTALPTVSSKTIYLSSSTNNKLTSTTKAIATGKGWIITNG